MTATKRTDELYGEWYSNFSLGKITGNDLSFAFVKDLGIIAGFNFAAEVNTVYYLPGVRFALDIPGFAFANLDVMAYIQDGTSNYADGTTIKEKDSYAIDFNWTYPFTIGSTNWTIEGHVEYIAGADNEINIPGVGIVEDKRSSWVLAQPQLRLDVGELIFSKKDKLFAGIEYQYWRNKLGDSKTKENVAQLLLVWRL